MSFTHPHYLSILQLQEPLYRYMPCIHALLSNLFRTELLTNLYTTDGCFQENHSLYVRLAWRICPEHDLWNLPGYYDFTVHPHHSLIQEIHILCLLTKIQIPYHTHMLSNAITYNGSVKKLSLLSILVTCLLADIVL